MILYAVAWHGYDKNAIYLSDGCGAVFLSEHQAKMYMTKEGEPVLQINVDTDILPQGVREKPFSYTGSTGTGCGGGYIYNILPTDVKIRKQIEQACVDVSDMHSKWSNASCPK